MKIRKCFVANSSSSSFVCDVCGEQTEAYMDASPSDFDMVYCVNGHVICNEHLIDTLTEEEEAEYEYEVPERICPICQFQVLGQNDCAAYLLETREVPRATVFEEIKKVNKRRKKLYNFEYIKYVTDKFELTEDMLLAEIKEKYQTYSNFASRNNN